MALPFLPTDSISSTYNLIKTQYLELPNDEIAKVQRMGNYIKRQWIDKVLSEELSIWDQEMSTNNGAENYHRRLKSIIKTNKPRIWNFPDTMNDIILDTDNELARLHRGLTITRALKENKYINSTASQQM